jgi:hypothetical protein
MLKSEPKKWCGWQYSCTSSQQLSSRNNQGYTKNAASWGLCGAQKHSSVLNCGLLAAQLLVMTCEHCAVPNYCSAECAALDRPHHLRLCRLLLAVDQVRGWHQLKHATWDLNTRI